jgi:hypothetical protein
VSRRFRSLATEFIVVVVGVVVALAADSAVDRRRQAASAESALVAVHRDLTEDVAQLDTFRLPYLESQAMARSSVGRWLASNEPIPDSLELIQALRRITTYLTFDANTAAVESLRSTGRLDLLEDERVRRALLKYVNRVEDVAEVDALQRAAVLEVSSRLLVELVGHAAWSGVHEAAALTVHPEPASQEARAAAATGLDAEAIRKGDALSQLLIATEQPFQVQRTLYMILRAEAENLDQLLRENLSGGT